MKKNLVLKLMGIVLIVVGVLKIQSWISNMVFSMGVISVASLPIYGKFFIFIESILCGILFILSGILLLLGNRSGKIVLSHSIIIISVVNLFPGMVISFYEIVFYLIILVLVYTLDKVKLYPKKL